MRKNQVYSQIFTDKNVFPRALIY